MMDNLGNILLVLLEEFQLNLMVMLGVLLVLVKFSSLMGLAGIKFQELLLISVLGTIMMFGLLIPMMTSLTLIVTVNHGLKLKVNYKVSQLVTGIMYGEQTLLKTSINGPILIVLNQPP